MPVPAFDLTQQYAEIGVEIEEAVRSVLRSTAYILGEPVERLEQSLERYMGVDHAVGVSSGSDALLVALMSEGIGAGDEVITTAYSFFATAGAIARLGARPVFVDIDPQSYNLDPDAVRAACTDRTRAIIAVHLFGRMADMPPLVDLARSRTLLLIEDAAQAIGGRIGPQHAGTFGQMGCFSFYPTKNLGAAGDGGLVVTADDERAAHLRRLRAHGSETKYVHREIGGNFRLDVIQAAVLQVKLRHLDRFIERRRAVAADYSQQLASLPGLDLPSCPDGVFHVYHQYVVRHPRRDALREHLTNHGIGSAIYYPRPLHMQQCFDDLGYARGAFPCSERAAEEALALPMFPELTTAQVDEVCARVREFCVG